MALTVIVHIESPHLVCGTHPSASVNLLQLERPPPKVAAGLIITAHLTLWAHRFLRVQNPWPSPWEIPVKSRKLSSCALPEDSDEPQEPLACRCRPHGFIVLTKWTPRHGIVALHLPEFQIMREQQFHRRHAKKMPRPVRNARCSTCVQIALESEASSETKLHYLYFMLLEPGCRGPGDRRAAQPLLPRGSRSPRCRLN